MKQRQGKGKGISIEDWGWRLPGDQIIPVMTDLPAVLVGEDTDLLVLLRFYIRLDSRDGEKEELQKTFMESEAIKKQLGRSDVCQNMLFIHSVVGCDTTSRFY